MTGVEIRLPELSGGTEAEQLRRMQKYLFTLAQQLQIAFDALPQQSSPPAAPAAPAAGGGSGGNQAVNFSAIKALIIKSADLTQHFQQEVEKSLQGRYVAQSQFGTFQQETQQRLTANSQELTQKFSNLQRLETTVEDLESSVLEINASIRTGLLGEENGQSLYGVEIGQQNRENGVIQFQKFARLTAEKLSFYDSGGVEVAYVSDRQLHVTAAAVREITTDSLTVRLLRLGEYSLELGGDGHLSIR